MFVRFQEYTQIVAKPNGRAQVALDLTEIRKQKPVPSRANEKRQMAVAEHPLSEEGGNRFVCWCRRVDVRVV